MPTRMRTHFRQAIAVMVAAVAAIATDFPARSPLDELINGAELLNSRFVTGRLSDFGYTDNSSTAAQRGVRKIAGKVLLDPRVSRDRYTAGIAQLATGNVSSALTALENAARNENTARLWNDLSVARYEFAVHFDDPRSFASALAAADNARELDSSNIPSRFNRAVALDALHIVPAAISAYRDYLSCDQSTKWAEEARRRIRDLSNKTIEEAWNEARPNIERGNPKGNGAEIAALIRQFPQQARTWAEGEYLARWGASTLDGKEAEANHWLTITRMIGLAIRENSGESLLYDAVTAIDRAQGTSVRTLAEAHLKYRNARRLYADRDIAASMPVFEQAIEAFLKTRSPMAFVAEYFLANALFDSHRPDEALRLLSRVDRDSKQNYVALKAQVAWERSTINGSRNRLYDSYEDAAKASDLFFRLGEAGNAARLQINAASTLSALGRSRIAWQYYSATFRAASALGGDLVDRSINAAAFDALTSDAPNIAHSLFEVEISLSHSSPRLHFDALLLRMLARNRLALPPEQGVRQRLDTVAVRVPDTALRADMRDDAQMAEATILTPANPTKAIQILDDVIRFRKETNKVFALSSAYVARARLYRRLSLLSAAKVDLLNAVDHLPFAPKSSRDDLTTAFYARAEDAFRELVDIYASDGDAASAFKIADRWRQFEFRGEWADNVREPSLEPATVVVHYVKTGSRVLALCADGNQYSAITLPQTMAFIEATAASLQAALHSDDDRALTVASCVLYRILISPLRQHLSPFQRLIVIPDRGIDAIPFALLRQQRDDAQATYLIETTTVIVAPSYEEYRSRRRTISRRVHERLLVVGDPAFDPLRNPALTRLPAAKSEANRVAALYPRHKLLVDKNATVDAVWMSINAAGVAHFACHAVADMKDPAGSFMVLAPDADANDSGRLYVTDITRMSLHLHPIIVLATCGSGSSPNISGGKRSLAMAFVFAGSTSVVGTLWELDDSIAQAISLEIHRELVRGAGPAEAVRAMQLHMLRSEDPLRSNRRSWAAFQTYGVE